PVASLRSILGDASRICVALDGVQDPGNVGTIVRLAAAFDASGVIALEGCADPFGPKAIRASAGAIIHVPVATARKSELLEAAREAGVPLFATVPAGHPASPPSRKAILVLGSEGAGVSSEIASVAEPLTIATSAAVESLNVAMAAAILLARSYESRSFSSASRADASS
ncbi:MAG: TrmH family RNA methyltransferase, partial [Thermoanaerobaculia bacterium]